MRTAGEERKKTKCAVQLQKDEKREQDQIRMQKQTRFGSVRRFGQLDTFRYFISCSQPNMHQQTHMNGSPECYPTQTASFTLM